MTVQIIHNDEGKPQYAVVPYDEYKKLINAKDEWEELTWIASKNDDVTVPHAVVSIMVDHDVSILGAYTEDCLSTKLLKNSIQRNLPYRSGKRQTAHKNAPEKSLRHFTAARQNSLSPDISVFQKERGK